MRRHHRSPHTIISDRSMNGAPGGMGIERGRLAYRSDKALNRSIETFLVRFRLVAQDQRRLRQRESDGERHDAEYFEADPKIRGLRTPDDLVERRQHEKE